MKSRPNSLCPRILLAFGLITVALFSSPSVRAEQPAADTIDLNAIKTPVAADPKIKALVDQLGAADTVKREEAEAALMTTGKPAIPLLKEAEASPNPEIAFRAKRLSARLSELAIRPGAYADVLPADAVMCFEVRDAATTFERSKLTPVAHFWDKPSTRAFFNGYKLAQLPNELKVLDAIFTLPKLASGKALFALGSPDTIEAHEIDPPLLYVLETQNMQSVEANIRTMFEGMNDAVKSKRKYKDFEIEEQNNASTVFGAQRIIHSLTNKGIESFLDLLKKPPEKALSTVLTDLKTKRPEADVYFRLAADGLKDLAEANQILDDDLYKMVETVGFAEGGFIEDALTLNANGIEEFVRISAGGDHRNKGLLAVLQQLPVKAAPPVQANQPQALDMIPYQAAFVATFSGDVAAKSAEMSAALRSLDALNGDPVHVDQNLNTPTPAAKNMLKPDEAVAPPKPPAVKSRAEEALNLGGGNVLEDKKEMKTPLQEMKDKKAANKKDKAAAEKAGELERTMPHIERLTQAGFSLEQLLQQSAGPMVIALFPERVDIAKLATPGAADNPADPDHVPMAALFGMYLKDPAPIEMALEKANKGLKPRYTKHVLGGGTLYAEDEDDDSGGFWLHGNYLAFGTSRDILDLASAAVLNQNGNERMTARAAYIDYMAKIYDPAALLNVFADSRQFFEMPYKMAQLEWQTDPKNPWPDYAVAGGILKGNLMYMKLKQAQGGLQIEAQTPLTMIGVLQAMLKPLKEAALIQ